MDFAKVVEELTIKNDINVMDYYSLKEKYFSSDESYKKFLEKFCPLLISNGMYPLLIHRKFDLLEKLFFEQYDKGCEEFLSKACLMTIAKEKAFSANRYDNYGEALWIFENSIGATKLKKTYDFATLNEIILEYVNFLATTDGEMFLDNFESYFENAKDIEYVSGSSEKAQKLLDVYFSANPRMKLCCDPMFLVTANYLVNTPTFECNEEFIDLVRNVIDISKRNEFASYIDPDFDKGDYLKLASFTSKKLDKIDPRVSKKENFARKLTKHFQINNNK